MAKKLTILGAMEMTVPYDPAEFVLPEELQNITVYPATPLFLMSPRSRIYLAKDVMHFRGYLSQVSLIEGEKDGKLEESEASIGIQLEEV